MPRITMRLIGLSFLKPAWCISNEPLENMPSGVEQSKQISGNSLSSSSVICGSMVQVLSTSPWLSRTMDPLEQQASSARPVKPCSPIGSVERPVAGTTCRPASVSSRMARRMVPSASCRAFSSVPSKSLANILIMGMPLLRLHDIVDENGRAPREARPSGERLSYTAAGPCSPVRMRITSSTGSTQILPSPTVPQSWKRRGNGRETNGKYASKEAASAPVPASAGTARGRGRGD